MPEEDEFAEFNAKTEASRQRFLLARAEAIDKYASLEHWLCSLFASLTKLDHSDAAIIFYRIGNARSRNAIIQELLDRQFGEIYHVYWRSMFKFIRKIDMKRNEIVHWHMGGNSADEHIAAALRPPGKSFFLDPQTASRTHDDLTDFMARTQFAATSICCFGLLKWGGLDDDKTAWREVFFRPITYPPPESHPLFRMMSSFQSERG
jgi:hypothetical protein